MGKFFAGILVAVVILAILGYLGFISFGKGKGEGTTNNPTVSATESVKEEDTKPETTVTVEVIKDVFLMDGKEVTLSQIKESVTDTSKQVKVVLVNNYASTKTWDEIKSALTEWGIQAVEE